MRWRRARSREDDLEREVRIHLELEAEEQAERGVTAADAAYAAQRAFGNVTATKEEVRRMWGWSTWDVFTQEIRYAFRNIRRAPGFALMVILTLALGIGASTAVFTIVDSVLLKPLTYRDSGQLVAAWEYVSFLGEDPLGPNPRHVDIWQQRATAFDGMGVFRHMQMGLGVGSDRSRLTGAVLCLPNLFEVLQVQPYLGRLFRSQDGVKGKDAVAILTYASWQSLFNGDTGAIGRTIRVDEAPVEVIGVLPADFHFPNANALRAFSSSQPRAGLPEPAVFLPAVMNFAEMEWNGNYANWVTIGRLKPGSSPREGEAQLNTIAYQIATEMMGVKPDKAADRIRVSIQPLQEAVVGASSVGLWFLLSAVLGLMLIACLNLANAQLGRAFARQRDAALRAALGAAKWRIVWNCLAENLVLAAIGGAAGVLLAHVALKLFRVYSPVDLPRLAETQLNGTVVLFAVALTILSSLISGLLPALKLIAIDPHASLQQGSSRTFGSKSGSRVRVWLIGMQVFGCTVLLLVTGLFARSLLHLLRQDKGFESRNVAMAEVKLPVKLYRDLAKRIEFIDTVLQNLRATPGVESVGLVSATPMDGESWIESLNRADRPDRDGTLVNARWVSPGYFEATGQRLISGRFFEERDRNLDSAVISDSSARALWGKSDPVGSQVMVLGRVHTVIGVVADSRITSLKTSPPRMAYVHYKFRPPIAVSFLVKSRTSAEQLIPQVRSVVWKSAPDVTLARLKTLDSQLTDSVGRERLQTTVLLSFGAAALFLAMIGIYGVLNYSVTARSQEIGVRMALGASKGSVYALTFAQASAPVCFGVASGLLVSLLAGRVIRRFLYGVEGVDPAVILIVVGLFLVSATMAAFLPARRAAGLDPLAALRAE